MRFIDWGIPMLVSESYIRDAKNLTPPRALSLVEDWNVPLKIVSAGKGILVPGARKYLSHVHAAKEHVIIPAAGHNFNEEGTEQQLFRETLAWFRKFS
jgi:pimeloyl-ACP methyl ester carboxylesterase